MANDQHCRAGKLGEGCDKGKSSNGSEPLQCGAYRLLLSQATYTLAQPNGNMPPASRQRASKACQRCAKRKVKCDAAATDGAPCSRCRMDGVEDCVLVDSLRGLYQRVPRDHRRRDCSTTPSTVVSIVDNAADQRSISSAASASTSASSARLLDGHLRYGVVSQDPPGRSLAGMFEEFVEEREHGGLGIILFGEASPLTFALEEHVGEKACFYDARPTLSENKRLVDRPREVHPPHCSP